MITEVVFLFGIFLLLLAAVSSMIHGEKSGLGTVVLLMVGILFVLVSRIDAIVGKQVIPEVTIESIKPGYYAALMSGEEKDFYTFLVGKRGDFTAKFKEVKYLRVSKDSVRFERTTDGEYISTLVVTDQGGQKEAVYYILDFDSVVQKH